MAYRKTAFVQGEWYHCYSRSIDGKSVFLDTHDYERFLQALYLNNSDNKIERNRFGRMSHQDILRLPRGSSLVAIGAYALMPNHFHLLIQQKEINGISNFMQRLGTSFSMYFNVKYQHIGNIFIKPFRAKHVTDQLYLRRVRQYIHLNPAELFEPGWKQGNVQDLFSLESKLLEYAYTSIPDYYEKNLRPEKVILDPTAMDFLSEAPEFPTVLEEARDYYCGL